MKRGCWNLLSRLADLATSQTVLNCSGPICYFTALFGIFAWGITVAIPFAYADMDPNVTSIVQGIGWFIAIELSVNWFCIYFVDSSCHHYNHKSKYHPKHSPLTSIRTEYTTKAGVLAGEDQNAAGSQVGNDSTLQYYRWTFCDVCGHYSPPRSHHCPLCKTCVLKRDHHCYVAASCVGYRNLRHFCVFLFYAVLATIFAMIHALPYAFMQVIPFVPSYFDLFYPVTIVRTILGYLSFLHCCLILLGWMLLIYLITSIFSLLKLYRLIMTGLTKYETENHMRLVDTRSKKAKLAAVFGDHWWANFLIPLHSVFEPVDDPFNWPSIKVT